MCLSTTFSVAAVSGAAIDAYVFLLEGTEIYSIPKNTQSVIFSFFVTARLLTAF